MASLVEITLNDVKYSSRTGKIKLDALPLEVDIGNNHYLNMGFVDNVPLAVMAFSFEFASKVTSNPEISDELLMSDTNYFLGCLDNSVDKFSVLLNSKRGELPNQEYVQLGVLRETSFRVDNSDTVSKLWTSFCRSDSKEQEIKTLGHEETHLLEYIENLACLERAMAEDDLHFNLSLFDKEVRADIGGLYALHKAGFDIFNLPSKIYVQIVAETCFESALKDKKKFFD